MKAQTKTLFKEIMGSVVLFVCFLAICIATMIVVGSCGSPTESRFAGQGLTFEQGADRVAEAYWSNPVNQFNTSAFAPKRSFYYEQSGEQAVGTVFLIKFAPFWLRPLSDAMGTTAVSIGGDLSGEYTWDEFLEAFRGGGNHDQVWKCDQYGNVVVTCLLVQNVWVCRVDFGRCGGYFGDE